MLRYLSVYASVVIASACAHVQSEGSPVVAGLNVRSFGYRFDTKDRSIVISGDTNPVQATIDACHGCDVLVHEAETPGWLATRNETFQKFAAKVSHHHDGVV